MHNTLLSSLSSGRVILCRDKFPFPLSSPFPPFLVGFWDLLCVSPAEIKEGKGLP